MSKIHIPELPHGCGSWVVIRKATRDVIGEFFDRSTVEKFNPDTCIVKTTYQYLVDLNAEIKGKPTK